MRDSIETTLLPKHKAYDKIVQVMGLEDSLNQTTIKEEAVKAKLDQTSNLLQKKSSMQMVSE